MCPPYTVNSILLQYCDTISAVDVVTPHRDLSPSWKWLKWSLMLAYLAVALYLKRTQEPRKAWFSSMRRTLCIFLCCQLHHGMSGVWDPSGFLGLYLSNCECAALVWPEPAALSVVINVLLCSIKDLTWEGVTRNLKSNHDSWAMIPSNQLDSIFLSWDSGMSHDILGVLWIASLH